MTVVVEILILVLALLLTVPVGMFCLEIALSLLPRRPRDRRRRRELPRIAVLIPAHNEAAVISRTLTTLMSSLPTGSRVYVVADNCTDDTAELARRHGAIALKRTDPDRRGKGFALDFGLKQLALDPPQAVVFLDADCQVRPDTVALLGQTAVAAGRPVQGLNLCDPDPRGGRLQAVSGLAFRFKNLVRTLGLLRLAGLCHLTGTGMALPWSLVPRVHLADGNVVEDMQLGINLTLAGYRPLYLPEARVDSPLPGTRAAAHTQRTRWEHGHLATLLVQVPRVLLLAFARQRLDLVWLALDLAIPPMSLLVMLAAAVWIAALVATLLGASPVALVAVSILAGFLALSVFVGWLAHCRAQIPLVSLLAAPLYAAWKVPIYVAFLVSRQRQWIRTQRDA
jgi:cellulose synthase/poly-beta-1,6-N-acetylglucosamine synthase-like glycosyltransferase